VNKRKAERLFKLHIEDRHPHLLAEETK
jgi:hypothetical protein